MTFDAWWEVNWQAVTTVNSEYRREDCRVVWDAATAAERERCCKALCSGCKQEIPYCHYVAGKWTHSGGFPCKAAAIRAEP